VTAVGDVEPDVEPVAGAAEVAARAGVSYRQLDHWIRQGWVPVPDGTPGKGTPRVFTPEAEAVAVAMGDLVTAGCTASAASVLAPQVAAGCGAVRVGRFEVTRVMREGGGSS
jgi:hypothetical protein